MARKRKPFTRRQRTALRRKALRELKADEKVQKAIERRLRKGSHKVQVMHEGTTERDLEYVGPSTGLPISKAPKYRVTT